MKICTKCKKRRRLSSFAKKYGKTVSYCKFCHRSYCKQHYSKNKSYYRKRNSRQRSNTYTKLREIKESTPCYDCKLFYPSCVMDFDHIVKGTKSFTIGSAAYGNSKTWDQIEGEIAKCQLVCANCHRVRTYHRRHKL